MVSAPVRIEAEAWTDLRFATLARLLGLREPVDALIRTARLWSWQTEHYTPDAPTYVVDGDTIESAIGEGAAGALVRSRLAEELPEGYRIRGSKGRIEWLWKTRQAGRAGGEATKRKYGDKTGPDAKARAAAGSGADRASADGDAQRHPLNGEDDHKTRPRGQADGSPPLQASPSPLTPDLVPDLVPEDQNSPSRAIPQSVPQPELASVPAGEPFVAARDGLGQRISPAVVHRDLKPDNVIPPGESAWHRRMRWWGAMLEAGDRLTARGLVSGSGPLPKNFAGENEKNLIRCERQLLDGGFSADEVDAKMRHIVLVAEAEATREGHRRWFKPALIWDPERAARAIDTSLEEARKPRLPAGRHDPQPAPPRPRDRDPPPKVIPRDQLAGPAELAESWKALGIAGEPSERTTNGRRRPGKDDRERTDTDGESTERP